jgi:hypothetical protein
VGPCLKLVALRVAVEQRVDGMPLVEEPATLGEVTQTVDARPDVAADESRLEVVGEDLPHHFVGAGMPLEDREVALKDAHELLVGERALDLRRAGPSVRRPSVRRWPGDHRLSDLPLVAEGILDPSEAPAMLFTTG